MWNEEDIERICTFEEAPEGFVLVDVFSRTLPGIPRLPKDHHDSSVACGPFRILGPRRWGVYADACYRTPEGAVKRDHGIDTDRRRVPRCMLGRSPRGF